MSKPSRWDWVHTAQNIFFEFWRVNNGFGSWLHQRIYISFYLSFTLMFVSLSLALINEREKKCFLLRAIIDVIDSNCLVFINRRKKKWIENEIIRFDCDTLHYPVIFGQSPKPKTFCMWYVSRVDDVPCHKKEHYARKRFILPAPCCCTIERNTNFRIDIQTNAKCTGSRRHQIKPNYSITWSSGLVMVLVILSGRADMNAK